MASDVAVVLSTYNGASYVAALLESIQRQTFRDWHLLVRDDGSSDSTMDIVRAFAERDARIAVLRSDGGNLGAPGSFGALLAAARDHGAQYVFLADQDDIWLEGKLARLLAAMTQAETSAGTGVPVLVYSDLMVVASDLRVIHPSFRRYQGLRPPPPATALATLLTQNFVTGCGSVLNRALLDIVVPAPASLAMHDWWIAQCAAATGVIVDVDEPTVLYRQHEANVLGAKGIFTLVRHALSDPRRWWARGRRNFLLGLGQATALGRRLEEGRAKGRGCTSADFVREYCAAFTSGMAPWQRLRVVRRLGAQPLMPMPRALYYLRVLLYGSASSALSIGS